MKYNTEKLRWIYQRTDGRCHICGKKLSFVNYGIFKGRGAWEVDHSLAKASGGSNHKNNLFPACITCNRSKGTKTSKAARTQNRRKKAPLSKAQKTTIRNENTLVGLSLGALVGGSLGGPPGAFIGGILGGIIGENTNPDTK